MHSKIDPSTKHPELCDLLKNAEITEDAFEGDVCDYVEVLDGQLKNERKDYLSRAAYFNVVQPTVSALIGAMMRKPFTMTGSFPATDLNSPDAFIQTLIKNILLGARTGICVTVENGASKLISYDVDDIINWSSDFVILKEEILVRDKDNPYQLVCAEAYLELYIGLDGYFHSRRWAKNNKADWIFEDLEDLVIPGVGLIDYIPFFVANPYDNTFKVYTPPLLTQAALNIQHFKQSVDLAHYAHFMALPTPYIAGNLATYSDGAGEVTTAEVYLGSTKHVLHLDKDATCGYMEVSGASFTMLSNELKAIEERMFIAGSRLLTNKAGVESASALQIRAANETATLETITNAIEAALNQALALCSAIDREEKSIALNKDFNSAVIDPALIQQLLALYTNNVITYQQFQEKLMSGEIIGKGTESE